MSGHGVRGGSAEIDWPMLLDRAHLIIPGTNRVPMQSRDGRDLQNLPFVCILHKDLRVLAFPGRLKRDLDLHQGRSIEVAQSRRDARSGAQLRPRPLDLP